MIIDDIKEAIKALFNFTIIEETEDKIIFAVISDKTAVLNKEQIRQIIQGLTSLNTEQDVELFDNNSYEVLVRQESGMIFSREIVQRDTVNKLEYKIDKPTDKYLVFFLCNLAKQNTPRILRSSIVAHRLRRIFENDRVHNQPSLFGENAIEINILEVIKEIVPRLETLQILSDNSKRKTEFEQLVYAFLFNLGYNLDYTILPLRFIDEFTQPYRISRLRRSSFSDVV